MRECTAKCGNNHRLKQEYFDFSYSKGFSYSLDSNGRPTNALPQELVPDKLSFACEKCDDKNCQKCDYNRSVCELCSGGHTLFINKLTTLSP